MENMQNRIPLLGEKMPDITVQTTHGVKNIPGDYAGKWIVLFSHPGDFTPVCTTEFVAFASRNEQFKNLNAELVGLSIDQVFAHIKWVEWIQDNLDVKIPFPIIADDMGRTAEKLGMIHPGKGTNTVRAVFIIDPLGQIRLMIYYPQEIGRRQIDEILRALKALQISDANKVAMPENWPNNEMLKDKVIIPPPKDMAGVEDRKQYEGPDWWFKYKSLN